MGRPLLLVLGGTRSGKSTYGLARISAMAGPASVAYLATVTGRQGDDPELDDRIRRHRAARPASWDTIEVDADLPSAVRSVHSYRPILLDGLTLWLSALIDTPTPDVDVLIDGPVAAGLAALGEHRGPVVVVSDEIGLGMVPMEHVSRAFRDLQGIVHQRLASMADEVVLTVAGLPLTLKAAAR
jgi:adenosylcobinamide kinase / adenosylcobinamide-phosphate guanylyltransferase